MSGFCGEDYDLILGLIFTKVGIQLALNIPKDILGSSEIGLVSVTRPNL